jgi:hypothetical protein
MFKVKGWYSEKKTAWTAARAGTKHGHTGNEPMADLVINARLGEEPAFDPSTNKDHADLDAQSKPHPQLAEWISGVQTAEKALTKLPNRWMLRITFPALLGVEYAATNDLLAGQGMENPHRAIVAIAASAIFFYLTYLASKGPRS